MNLYDGLEVSAATVVQQVGLSELRARKGRYVRGNQFRSLNVYTSQALSQLKAFWGSLLSYFFQELSLCLTHL